MTFYWLYTKLARTKARLLGAEPPENFTLRDAFVEVRRARLLRDMERRNLAALNIFDDYEEDS